MEDANGGHVPALRATHRGRVPSPACHPADRQVPEATGRRRRWAAA